LTGRNSLHGLFVTRLRRPTLTHAFERALDDARFDAPLGSDSGAAANQSEDPAQKFQSALETLPEIAGSSKYVAASSLAAAYKAEAEQAETPKPPREPPRAPRTERPQPAKRPQPIKLRPGLAVRDLKRLRRLYALDNHPDRVPVEMREEAARVMAEANAAIDKALKRAGGD
jgi:hypothetical protein